MTTSPAESYIFAKVQYHVTSWSEMSCPFEACVVYDIGFTFDLPYTREASVAATTGSADQQMARSLGQ